MLIHRRTPGTHGFTLVELMVALSGGLFLSVMVFALARDTSRFYQREGRLAGATLAGMMGFERLKTDIARAGYMTTPNILNDPKVCMNPAAGWPPMLQRLAGIRINQDLPDLSGNAAIDDAGLTPDELVLAGSYSVSEAFPLRDATGQNLVLQVDVAPMARLGYLAAGLTAPLQQALLETVFRQDRILRLTDDAGLHYFGIIDSVTGGAQPTVTLKANPALTYGGGPQSCGIQGRCTGCMVSVINIVRYQIQDLRAAAVPRFAPLFAASAGAPGELTRTELVREELNANGSANGDPIETATDRTTELVAEYAVDLGFSVTAQLPATTQAVDLQPGIGNFGQIFNATWASVGAPQLVRAVRVRLSVRSREGDRDAAIAGGLYRFKLPDGDWARVRTFQADVALPNQADVRWF